MITIIYRLTVWNYHRKVRVQQGEALSALSIYMILLTAFTVLYFGGHVVWYFIR